MSWQTPPEPTPQQCDDREQVAIVGAPGVVAHAVWWPQMGGHVGRAVITVGDCSELWLWHDGQSPIHGGPPQQIHLDHYGDWVDLFEWLQGRYDEVYNGGPQPYRWYLPDGVSEREAELVYRKAVEWGLWELDPGGFEIVTADQRHTTVKPCVPIPCPSFTDYDPAAEMNTSGYRGAPQWQIDVYQTWVDRVSRDLLVKGEALLDLPGTNRGTYRWSDLWTSELPNWVGLVEGPPQVDGQRDAADPRQVRPQYPGGPDRLDRWLDNPDWDAANAPLFIGLPTDLPVGELAAAIALCQRVGLISETPNGILYIPEELELS